MFSSDKRKQTFRLLIAEFKKYLSLQKQYATLELTEKLALTLSVLILVLFVIMLGTVALFFFSFTLAFLLAPRVGEVTSFALIGCLHIVLICLIYAFRHKWIINPIIKSLARLFLNKKN